MIEELLAQEEGKTLEFKENTHSLGGIVKTVVAFANTAGGILVIGVKNRTKEIVGLIDVLKEEERVANAIADSVAPLLVPDIEMRAYREREILILRVPHAAGPFYIKSDGEKQGTYIRFGSTNRVVDEEMLSALRLFAANLSFDETSQINGLRKVLRDFPEKNGGETPSIVSSSDLTLVKERWAWCVVPSGVFVTSQGKNSELLAASGN